MIAPSPAYNWVYWKKAMIKGSKILLRPVAQDDLPVMEAWAADPAAAGEFNDFGLHGHTSFQQGFDQTGMLDERHGTLLVATLGGAPVGDVTYRQVMYGPNQGSQAYNIGIALLPDQRGKGYGVEAQSLLASYLFATYTVQRVEASTDITNLAEQRALEKAGFTREGVMRQAQWRNGAWHDLVVYSKLRGE